MHEYSFTRSFLIPVLAYNIYALSDHEDPEIRDAPINVNAITLPIVDLELQLAPPRNPYDILTPTDHLNETPRDKLDDILSGLELSPHSDDYTNMDQTLHLHPRSS